MSAELVIQGGIGWIKRGDGQLYTAMPEEYVREIEQLRSLLVLAKDEHYCGDSACRSPFCQAVLALDVSGNLSINEGEVK